MYKPEMYQRAIPSQSQQAPQYQCPQCNGLDVGQSISHRLTPRQSIFERIKGLRDKAPDSALILESQGLQDGSYVVGDEYVAVRIIPQKKE